MVTRIEVHVGEKTEEWLVPEGFEHEYLIRVKPVAPNLWVDMLAVAGIRVPRGLYGRITQQQRIEAEIYATYRVAGRDFPRPTWL